MCQCCRKSCLKQAHHVVQSLQRWHFSSSDSHHAVPAQPGTRVQLQLPQWSVIAVYPYFKLYSSPSTYLRLPIRKSSEAARAAGFTINQHWSHFLRYTAQGDLTKRENQVPQRIGA